MQHSRSSSLQLEEIPHGPHTLIFFNGQFKYTSSNNAASSLIYLQITLLSKTNVKFASHMMLQ